MVVKRACVWFHKNDAALFLSVQTICTESTCSRLICFFPASNNHFTGPTSLSKHRQQLQQASTQALFFRAWNLAFELMKWDRHYEIGVDSHTYVQAMKWEMGLRNEGFWNWYWYRWDHESVMMGRKAAACLYARIQHYRACDCQMSKLSFWCSRSCDHSRVRSHLSLSSLTFISSTESRAYFLRFHCRVSF